MAVKDYYRLMGISRVATEEEIKKAYRNLVLEYHPDRNRNDPNCEERLKEINEAYQVLGNEKKRRQYDLVYRKPVKNQVFYDRDLGDEIAIIFREFSRSRFSMRGRRGCRGNGFEKKGAGGGVSILRASLKR